jgi:4-aminobutyrate aminotransferase-like enzyme
MAEVFDTTPCDVPRVETPFRRIVTPVPHPDSLATLETLRRCEPLSMQGQPPIVWERAEGVQVWDRHGNMWLDWSSGVLVTNAGHGDPAIRAALIDQVESGLLHNYCFPSEERAELADALVRLAPGDGGPGGWKVFLLTTGAETTENAIKLARSWGLSRDESRRKIGIVTFQNAFHGRTLGAQQIGGFPGQRDWIVNLDPDIHHVPFPDGFFTEDIRFELFLETLERLDVTRSRRGGDQRDLSGGGALLHARALRAGAGRVVPEARRAPDVR